MTNQKESNLVSNLVPNQGVRIHHDGFSYDDERQKMVQMAYDIGGFDFVKTIECENGNWSPFAVGDSGHAFGLCQMNNNYHKNIPQEYFDDWGFQIKYCYEKWKTGTKFYGPGRIVKGKKCFEYVENRFTFVE